MWQNIFEDDKSTRSCYEKVVTLQSVKWLQFPEDSNRALTYRHTAIYYHYSVDQSYSLLKGSQALLN